MTFSPIAILALVIGASVGWRFHQTGVVVYYHRKKALPFGYRDGVLYGLALSCVAVLMLTGAVLLPLATIYRIADAFVASILLGASLQQVWFCSRFFSGRRP